MADIQLMPYQNDVLQLLKQSQGRLIRPRQIGKTLTMAVIDEAAALDEKIFNSMKDKIMKTRTVIHDEAKVASFMDNPDAFIALKEDRSNNWQGLKFTEALAWLLAPDQLKHTAETINNAARGVRKIVSMMVPREDILVLEKYGCTALPNELAQLLDNKTITETGHILSGTLKDPFTDVTDVNDFRAPLNIALPAQRPDGDLFQAFERQLGAVLSAIETHESRLMERVDAYMFGRPLVTAKQRVLSYMMDTYSELDWENKILPYLDLRDRKV